MSSRITRFGDSSTLSGSDLIILLHLNPIGGLFQLLFWEKASRPILSLTYSIRGNPTVLYRESPIRRLFLVRSLFKGRDLGDLVILLRSEQQLAYSVFWAELRYSYVESPRFGVSS
jgi:hypothetical protein